ncbi:proton-conducting transporter transmembrane domain-containing protein [Streptomyces chilikensis]|uniref:Proton-conducting transporter membrane subunit n=1 Tax=Streptomyces chilikensis TaxID=1194079 RepID=A0ABV3EQR6_9ACTN
MRLALVALPVLVPLLAAGLSLIVSASTDRQRTVTLTALALVLADAIALLAVVERDGTIVVRAGDWAPPLGVVLVADLLAAMLLALAVLVALAVLLFAVGQDNADRGPGITVPYHPSYLVLVAGIALAFLAGDLFNLFVAFEMLLSASYVLITLDAGAGRVRAGMTYVITSLTSSLLFLTALGLVYSALGTVNLADLAVQAERLSPGLRTALSLMLLVVFGIKAAVVPLHFWLPDSYPTAPAPITAVFAALLTKVGVYAMVRTESLVFPRDGSWWVAAVLAVATMLVGILGAIAQDDINRLLSFTLVSHVGFMIFGLALSDVAGLTGTILYILHHITAQATLFLVAGLIVNAAGTAELSRMERGEGARRVHGVTALLFLVGGLSMAGIPPLSGFVAKFALLRAAAAHGGAAAYLLAGAALVTSVLTLYAMVRVWRGAFSPGLGEPLRLRRRPGVVLTMSAAVAMTLTGLGLAAAAGPLADMGERAATELVRPAGYRDAVLVGEGAGR